MKILVIGGGLFGCCASFELAKGGHDVEIAEEQSDIMMRASKINHNRIHLGYHYLRSIDTAEQSIEGLLSFMFNFGESVVHQFDNYYAIAKEGSKTTPDQFIDFCNKVGIGYDYEFPAEKDIFDVSKLAASFKVPEPVFDFNTLKKLISHYLLKSKVKISLNTKCTHLKYLNDNRFEVELNATAKREYDIVINSSYASFNLINSFLEIPPKKLLYEDVVVPIFEYEREKLGLTVMDGPFCSVMPHGKAENRFLLYHVKHSLLHSQIDYQCPVFLTPEYDFVNTVYENYMILFPFLKKVKSIEFNRITRVVHENSDDARLTELHTYDGFPNYFAILSGKVSTCLQVALEVKHLLENKRGSKRFRI